MSNDVEPESAFPELIRRAPKVLLHDHLDGGLRPQTVIDLARDMGYVGLPTEDPVALRSWFLRGAYQLSLPLYLEAIGHAVGVMQTAPGIERVAREAAEDLAADGVVYAELRFAPELFTRRGLALDAIVEAAWAGFQAGMASAAAAGTPIVVRILIAAMRQAKRSAEIADLAVSCRHLGVVGFDIAGPEFGYPAADHADAFRRVRAANLHLTVHAGEDDGLTSIHQAVEICGAERLGHGVRIVDDIRVERDGTQVLGPLAAYIRDREMALEVCPTSNVHTGVAPSIAANPIDRLRRLGFKVTVNTDDRLLSDVSMTSELEAVTSTFDLDLADVRQMTVDAMRASFLPYDQRITLIASVLEPAFAALASGT